MKTSLARFTLLLALFFCAAGFGMAQKVGVVNVSKVLDGYYKMKDAKERLVNSEKAAREELSLFQKELNEHVVKLKEMEKKMQNPNIDTSSLRAEYQEMVKKAQEKRDDLIQYKQRVDSTLATRRRNLIVENVKDVREAVGIVAAARKLDLVLNSAEGHASVLYVGAKLDVTGDVLAHLNAKAPK